MSIPIYQPALTGSALETALTATADARQPLIEGLVYERSVILMSADAGVGKSTVLANIIAPASAGLPVFQLLPVPRPLLCYYIPFERGTEEILERLKHIQKVIPFNAANIKLFQNSTFPTPNLYLERDQDFLLDSIETDCPNQPPDLVFYDPIYQAVAGGLSDENKVSLFIRFNVRLMARFGCSTWLNHNTSRDRYAVDGTKIEREDPYYGSSFLKNHCTGSYFLKANPDIDGTTLIRKKDNFDLLLKRLDLFYEPETYTCYVKGHESGLPIADRLRLILRQLKSEKNHVTFRCLQGRLLGVSTSYLRRMLCTPPFIDYLKKYKSNGEATLYEIVGNP